MMAAEFFGRIFCGSDAHADPARGGATLRHQGVCMIVVKADLFQDVGDYQRTADEMHQRTRSVPPAPGFDEVLVPGEPEHRNRATRQQEGIPIEDDIWQSIVDTAQSVDIHL